MSQTPPPFSCLEIDEVILTSITENILKISVDHILFILTVAEIESLIISTAGISNHFFIRFERQEGQDRLSPLSQWTSFHIGTWPSYPCQCFSAIKEIQAVIVKLLNNRRTSSSNNLRSEKITVQKSSFDFVRTLVNRQILWKRRFGYRTERRFTHDLKKVATRRRVCIEELESLDSDGIESFTCIFGVVIRFGSRTRHPSLNT